MFLRYERNTETDDGIKKYNQNDKSIYPSAQKTKLMKAEIADKIQRGKLPTVQGVKDLQHVADISKDYDGMPI